MITELPTWVADWGLPGVVLLAVVFGLLIPRTVVNKMQAVFEKRLADKDAEIARLRTANETLTATLMPMSQRLDVAVEAAKTSEQLLRSFSAAAGRIGT